MAPYLLGLPNIAARGSTLFSAFGPEPVVGEADNLKTEEPQVTARITTTDPPYSRWRIQSVGDVFDLDAIALVNHNIKDKGYFRVVSELTLEVLIPAVIISSGNIVGTVSRIENEISNPDGNFIIPATPTTSWNLHIGFSSSGVVAKIGEAMAIVGVSVEISGTPIDVYPTVRAELWDNGNLISSFGYRAITKTEIMLFPFNPALLSADPDFDNIEIKLFFFPGDNNAYAMLETVNIYYEDIMTVHAVDSLWVSVNQEWVSAKDGNLPTRSAHYVFSQTHTNLDDIQLIILNDESTHNPPTAGNFGLSYVNSATVAGLPPIPIDGFVEIGCVVFGPIIKSYPGMANDSTFPASTIVTENNNINTTQSGQTFSIDLYSQRGIPSSIEILCDRDTMMKILTSIWQKGKSGPFYIIQEPDLELKYQLFTSFYCTCTRISSSAIPEMSRTGKALRSQDIFIVTLELQEML